MYCLTFSADISTVDKFLRTWLDTPRVWHIDILLRTLRRLTQPGWSQEIRRMQREYLQSNLASVFSSDKYGHYTTPSPMFVSDVGKTIIITAELKNKQIIVHVDTPMLFSFKASTLEALYDEITILAKFDSKMRVKLDGSPAIIGALAASILLQQAGMTVDAAIVWDKAFEME